MSSRTGKRQFFHTIKRLLWWAFLLLLAYQLWIFAHVVAWKWINPSQSSFMALRLAELREQNPQAQLQHQWVDYTRMSVHLKRAVVAAEDDRFMDHWGLDTRGIELALKKNQRRGRSVAGGSSITQQLAKNLFLSPTRSYVRKAQEVVIALMLELVWDKRRILEVYLNMVEWGNGIFGAEAAARHYYGTAAADLGPAQAVRMAVMLPNPRTYQKAMPAWVMKHAARVQARMHHSRIP
ncbi:monofunctional biosynthetic peptidoglycan transglycosylase [Cellvibrio japonicus]|nr:monofunctional biosynthetic peptidoglycan transglycosylase [Cellvibrio japonicus]QEI11643.1 monofunctional biosynthetic peptidoglycan transglycosylase [Cellvibrio japonicus]QEI15217.1 monofunctional biosynthetic peptidoglycan transglycosylase [Cellvibrio japonicus]QEI18797.1 monofunctional biosynthetic peptidoglycan transglycosylase [Cellvibrio japonicus]